MICNVKYKSEGIYIASKGIDVHRMYVCRINARYEFWMQFFNKYGLKLCR